MSAGTTFLCSCEETMPLHGETVARACRTKVRTADQLCRRELDFFKAVLPQESDVIVACTQEAPLFAEVAEDIGYAGRLTFANVREKAGWAAQARSAGPKTAALLAAAAEDMPPIQAITLESKGIALVYGVDEVAIEAARRLSATLDVTVLLTRPGDVTPPRTTEFPVVKGTITGAVGHLGAFNLRIDDYALPSPSSRRSFVWQPPRDGATSECDLVLDLSGRGALFPAAETRAGYLRADPRDAAAVERLIGEAGALVGTFDKPRFITFDPHLCAHSRSKITGCTRCLDLCPTGAISPNGDHVAIDPAICAGCGQCAAACPTGAASYALPPMDALMRRLRTLVTTYLAAGGAGPVLLLHDADHGEPLIDASARFGTGLPANVLPLQVNEITQIGPEFLAAALAYGADGIVFLGRAKPKHELSGLGRTIATTSAIAAGLGYGEDLIRLVETDDPDALQAAVAERPERQRRKAATFLPLGGKRGLLDIAFHELHAVAPAPVDMVALGKGAPFGKVELRNDACTLCLSCVSACPTGALSDNPDRPLLAFAESLCVQCGLCERTCPEDAIDLIPQIDFLARRAPRRILKEEEPFHCIDCGKAFGTKSVIDKIAAKLERHWMFSGDNTARRGALFTCEDCRIARAVNDSLDPYAAPARPPARMANLPPPTRTGKNGLN